MPEIKKVGHVVLEVRDPQRAIKFYIEALGMEWTASPEGNTCARASTSAGPPHRPHARHNGRTACGYDGADDLPPGLGSWPFLLMERAGREAMAPWAGV